MKSIPANNLQNASFPRSPLFNRHIYVLPTKNGIRFFIILIILFLVAINSESTVGWLFCLILFWIALVSILHTYRNLRGIVLEAGGSLPAFVGQDMYFKMKVKNKSPWSKETIRVRWKEAKRVSLSLAPYQSELIEVPIPTLHRGLFKPGKFRLYTQFPLGLFFAWTFVEFPIECVVYPKPVERNESLFSLFFKEGKVTREEREDFEGFRKYQHGDSLKHIAWKAFARGDEVLTKEFVHPVSETLWLDWNAVPLPNTEEKLSFLCRAILEAERMGHYYGLIMPSIKLDPNVGEPHKHRCLKILAVFKERTS